MTKTPLATNAASGAVARPGQAPGGRNSSEPESFPAVHSAPGSHIAADGRHPAGRRSGLSSSCRFPRCPKSIIRSSRCSPSIPARGPEVMASSVTAPLERQFGQMPGLKQMTSVSSGGGSVITLEFNLDENIDVAEQEVQAAINAATSFLAHRSAQSADLQQGEPGRRAHHDAGADLRFAAAGQDRRRRRHQPGAEDFAGDGRGAGVDRRRAKALGAHPGQSCATGCL